MTITEKLATREADRFKIKYRNMKQTLIIVLLLISCLSNAQNQIDIKGRVLFNDLTRKHLQISKQIDSTIYFEICNVSELKKGKISVKSLKARLKFSKSDSVYFNISTDDLGRFEVKQIPIDKYDVEINVAKYLSSNSSIDLSQIKRRKKIDFYLSDSLYIIKTDSIIYSQIPYNSERAKKDIREGRIYYLQLFADTSFLDNDDIERLEKKWGFTYLYDYPEFPKYYLVKAQDDYNRIVIWYLDDKCNCDFQKEYEEDLRQLFMKKYNTNE